jgi:hypothetical protein
MDNNQSLANASFLPKVGQILYQETLNPDSSIKNSCLFFIDSAPEGEKSLLVTWLVQMEDYGNGVGVYTEPDCGGMPRKNITRVATDADISSFVQILKKIDPKGQQAQKWLKDIKEVEDWSPLLPEEKERLIRIIQS